MKKTALLSVYDKSVAFANFAYGLSARHGFNLLASTGTVQFLKKHNIDAQDVAEIVGPPILGHRVVTLSREVYAALLVRPNNPDDMAELNRLSLSPIDLVYVSMYPLLDAVADKDKTDEQIIEMIDIGGPTMLRAANKAGRIALANEEDFPLAIEILNIEASNGNAAQQRASLRTQTESVVAEYVDITMNFYLKLQENLG